MQFADGKIPNFNQESIPSFSSKVFVNKNVGKIVSGVSADFKESSFLMKREGDVIRHEGAHEKIAGKYAEPAEYMARITEGRVPVNMEVPTSPEKSFDKFKKIEKAALAPAHPSSQDKEVAAKAVQLQREARAKLTKSKDIE